MILQSDNASKAYFASLISLVDSYVEKNPRTLVVYLEAGHFNSKYGADEFSLSSLQDAICFGLLVVKKYKKAVRLVYGILIDDLGINCSGDACTVAAVSRDHDTRETLPPELEEAIASSRLIKRDRVMLFSERMSKIVRSKVLEEKLNNEVRNGSSRCTVIRMK